MAKIVGIDLGTTNSVVAAMEGGSHRYPYGGRRQHDAFGCRFQQSGERLVGQTASAGSGES